MRLLANTLTGLVLAYLIFMVYIICYAFRWVAKSFSYEFFINTFFFLVVCYIVGFVFNKLMEEPDDFWNAK